MLSTTCTHLYEGDSGLDFIIWWWCRVLARRNWIIIVRYRRTQADNVGCSTTSCLEDSFRDKLEGKEIKLFKKKPL